jgi:DNA polymerase I
VNALLAQFAEIWCVDFEFISLPGERNVPVCLVAKEVRSNRQVRLWHDEMGPEPPYPTGPHSLFVAYFASAELGCHQALGWPAPARILDLFTEFRNRFNCLETITGRSDLLSALVQFGLDSIGGIEKKSMQELAGRGFWTQSEMLALSDYCAEDVNALCRLLLAMESKLDLGRACLRGRYMAASAHMEFVGTPIDIETLDTLRSRWSSIKLALVAEVDKAYGVYDGESFREERFDAWLLAKQIPWPRTDTGHLKLTDGTFREMAKVRPEVNELRELRYALSKMKLNKLAVGQDTYNRCLLSPFVHAPPGTLPVTPDSFSDLRSGCAA